MARRSGIAMLAVLAAAGGCDEGGRDVEALAPELYTVDRGTLHVTVREAGEIQAATVTTLRSGIEGRTTVLHLVPEGTRVEEGDVLARLDGSELVDERAEKEIELENARAALVRAEQQLEIQLKELEAAEENARSTLTIAEMELEKFLGRSGDAATGRTADRGATGTNADMLAKLEELVEGTEYQHLAGKVRDELMREPGDLERDMGDLAQRVLRQIDEIRLAESELKVAEDTYEHSRRLAAKDYITKNELDRDRLARDSQASKVDLAWNQLDLLISYSLKVGTPGAGGFQGLIALRQGYENAKLELERVLATNAARRAREEADFAAAKAEFELQKDRFENLVRQIDQAVIRAPTAGLVVYAREGRRGHDVVEEGSTVRERQPIVILPDIDRMIAIVKVHETDIDKVVRGQKATLEVDAFPRNVYRGTVTRVAPLPDSGERWSNDDLKVYKTRIDLEGTHEELRPGMSATVEIEVGEIREALRVPLQAVAYERAVPYVWKRTPSGPVATPVDLGHATPRYSQIVAGLRAGDQVYLATPPGAAPPAFPQPGKVEPAPPEALQRAAGTRPADASARQGRQGRRGPRGPRSGLMKELTDLLVRKHPELADELQQGAMSLYRNPAIREAIRSDPELRALSERIRERMRARMGGKGKGRPRGGRERAGGRRPESGRRGRGDR